MSLLQTPSIIKSPEPIGITIRETKCTTVLHRLVYRASTGYTANLYKGCTHGCVYCYAPSLTHDERRWGSYVDVKVNAPEIMARELRGLRKDQVFLSSASDPYQPAEARYCLTRRCLKKLLMAGFPVSILTRSPLVLRDLDLLVRFNWIRVGVSITTVPAKQFEPGVPPLERRIETLKRLGKAGIRTWVSLAPVIPGLMMVDLDNLFEKLSDADVSFVSFGLLRFAGYPESERLFMESARMTLNNALGGQEVVVAKLRDLSGIMVWFPKRAESGSQIRQTNRPLTLSAMSSTSPIVLEHRRLILSIPNLIGPKVSERSWLTSSLDGEAAVTFSSNYAPPVGVQPSSPQCISSILGIAARGLVIWNLVCNLLHHGNHRLLLGRKDLQTA